MDMSQVELARRVGPASDRDRAVRARRVRAAARRGREAGARARDQPGISLFRPQPAAGDAAGGRAARPCGPARAAAGRPAGADQPCATSSCAAIGCRTTAWRRCSGRGRSRWCWRAAAEEPGRLLGRDALVELADGRCLLRRLMPSAAPDRFDLAAYNAPLLPMVAVSTARSIVGVLWPDAWREASGEPIRVSAEPLRLMRNSRLSGSLKDPEYFNQIEVDHAAPAGGRSLSRGARE